jgi:hypothetical protein
MASPTDDQPRGPSDRLWKWIVALLLLALLVWLVGTYLSRHPRPEIGVGGGERAAPEEQQQPAGGGDTTASEGTSRNPGGGGNADGGGESSAEPAVPSSPAPQR